jgi:nicotinic acid mononucleotide adenylyltransferase
LKRRAAAGLALTYLVPPAVEEYIKTMKLYAYQGTRP